MQHVYTSLREELLLYDVHMLLMYSHTVEVLVNIPEKCAGCLLIPSGICIMQSLCKLHPSVFGSVDIRDKTSCTSCATNEVDVGMFVSHTVTIISLSCTDTCIHWLFGQSHIIVIVIPVSCHKQ